jgi:hypothetical protein
LNDKLLKKLEYSLTKVDVFSLINGSRKDKRDLVELQSVLDLLDKLFIQWAPLNWITLGPRQTDPINNGLIPLTDKYFGINSK